MNMVCSYPSLLPSIHSSVGLILGLFFLWLEDLADSNRICSVQLSRDRVFAITFHQRLTMQQGAINYLTRRRGFGAGTGAGAGLRSFACDQIDSNIFVHLRSSIHSILSFTSNVQILILPPNLPFPCSLASPLVRFHPSTVIWLPPLFVHRVSLSLLPPLPYALFDQLFATNEDSHHNQVRNKMKEEQHRDEGRGSLHIQSERFLCGLLTLTCFFFLPISRCSTQQCRAHRRSSRQLTSSQQQCRCDCLGS